ncbi:hypothetical protein J7E62_09405 [Variovorax paradoxus]|nr:hypothetical protein [Variovorax paradoxus]
MSAVIDRPRTPAKRATATAPAAPTAAQQPQRTTAALTVQQCDRFTSDLSAVAAVITMLQMVFLGDCEIEKPQESGAMGALQFVQRTLESLKEEAQEIEAPLDELYWGIHFASSLADLLDAHQWAEGYAWSLSEEFLVNYLTGIDSSVERARAALRSIEVPA